MVRSCPFTPSQSKVRGGAFTSNVSEGKRRPSQQRKTRLPTHQPDFFRRITISGLRLPSLLDRPRLTPRLLSIGVPKLIGKRLFLNHLDQEILVNFSNLKIA